MEPILLLFGAGVSAIVQMYKYKFESTPALTVSFALGLSFLTSVGFALLQEYNLWESFVQVATVAGAIYGLVIKNVEDVLKDGKLKKSK